MVEEKKNGGGSIKIWAYESKVIGQKFLAEGSLDDLSIAERMLHKLLVEVGQTLFRMRASSTTTAYKPSKAKVSAEDGLIILTSTIGCDIVSASAVNAQRLRESLPPNYIVTVK